MVFNFPQIDWPLVGLILGLVYLLSSGQKPAKSKGRKIKNRKQKRAAKQPGGNGKIILKDEYKPNSIQDIT